MFICSVDEARVISDKETMSYTYYLENVKPKHKMKVKKDMSVLSVAIFMKANSFLRISFVLYVSMEPLILKKLNNFNCMELMSWFKTID